MNRGAVLKVTNLILFISMSLEAATGLFLFFKLLTDRPKVFMAIVEFHEYNGIFLIVLVSIHLAQNWGWIRGQFFRSAKR
jgi:hypothetical protein